MAILQISLIFNDLTYYDFSQKKRIPHLDRQRSWWKILFFHSNDIQKLIFYHSSFQILRVLLLWQQQELLLAGLLLP